MTIEELIELFETRNDEYLKFDRIENPLHPRPDICVFLLLDKLVPNPRRKMVSGAEHDRIFLDGSLEDISAVITEEDVITLIRCGVSTDDYDEGLAMFV